MRNVKQWALTFIGGHLASGRMNQKISIVGMLALVGMLTSAHMRSDTVAPRAIKKGDFQCNPLTLNDKPLDYVTFSIFSQGRLALVACNPESNEATKIPFRIYLVRAGEIITKGVSDNSQPMYAVEVETVLALAKPGDDLVIDPVQKTNGLARSVIKVQSMNWPLPLNWLSSRC